MSYKRTFECPMCKVLHVRRTHYSTKEWSWKWVFNVNLEEKELLLLCEDCYSGKTLKDKKNKKKVVKNLEDV